MCTSEREGLEYGLADMPMFNGVRSSYDSISTGSAFFAHEGNVGRKKVNRYVKM